MFRSKRWLLIANLLVAVVLLATACYTPAPPPPTVAPGATPTPTSAPRPATPTTPPAAEKVLRIASAYGCTATSPGGGGASECVRWMEQIYESLCFHDYDGNIVPWLATSWELIEPSVWEYRLREGVKFQNGEDFNAEAVKFSVEVYLDEERAWPQRSTIALIESVEIVDNYTVNFHTAGPWPDLPWYIYQVLMLPPKYAEEVGVDDGLVANPVGTGPFKFVRFEANDYLELEAFDDYWRGRANIDRVLWRIIPEPAIRVAAAQAGEVDIVKTVPLDLIPVVDAEPGIGMEYAAEQVTLLFYLDGLPATESPLLDKRVREALDYGIDKQAIADGLMGGLAPVNGQLLTPGVFGYNPDIEQTPYDTEEARRLLAEAGYADGLTVFMHCPVGKYFVDRDACIAAKAQLAEVGVDVDLHIEEPAVFIEAVSQPEKRADMIYLGWYNWGHPAQAMQWFSRANPWSRFHNDEYDELFVTARTSLDEEERLAAYQRMGEILKEETAAIFLMQQPATWVVSDRVVDWHTHPEELVVLRDIDVQD